MFLINLLNAGGHNRSKNIIAASTRATPKGRFKNYLEIGRIATNSGKKWKYLLM